MGIILKNYYIKFLCMFFKIKGFKFIRVKILSKKRELELYSYYKVF